LSKEKQKTEFAEKRLRRKPATDRRPRERKNKNMFFSVVVIIEEEIFIN